MKNRFKENFAIVIVEFLTCITHSFQWAIQEENDFGQKCQQCIIPFRRTIKIMSTETDLDR